jgi:vitamin B12 transporter
MVNRILGISSPRIGWLLVPIIGMTSATISSPARAQEQTLPETVVTATRIQTPLEQVGSSVTVITSEELERRQVRVISDVLRDVPGLAVNRTGVVGNLTQVRIRGTEANQSLVVIDGVRVNHPNGGGFDFNSLLNLEIERIEVLRGPSSVLWGSDAIGGVINIITKRAQRPLQASIAAEGGSFGTGQVVGSLGSRRDQYDILLSGTYYDTRGQSSGAKSRGNREDDGARIDVLNLKAGIRPTDSLEFNLVGGYNDANTQLDEFIGGTERPVVDADRETDKTEYSLRAEGKLTLLDGTWEHILSAGLYDIDTDSKAEGETTFESDGRTHEVFYQTNYFFETPAFGKGEHTLTFLADAKGDESKSNFFSKQSIDNQGYALNYNVGFYDKLFFTAGVRHDDNDRFEDTDTYRLTGAYVQRDWQNCSDFQASSEATPI